MQEFQTTVRCIATDAPEVISVRLYNDNDYVQLLTERTKGDWEWITILSLLTIFQFPKEWEEKLVGMLDKDEVENYLSL